MMDILTVLSNNAYPTPFANNPILPLLLISLAKQKNAPTTTKTFNIEYDYIIVGAGSAGSVVASRLSEIPCVSVLLLEAGKSPPLLTDVPAISGYHTIDGPLTVHKPLYETQIKKPLIEAAKSLGYKLVDSNGRRQKGFYDPQGTLRNGQRCSTAKAYLVPAENRTNLNIVTRAYVKKVVIEGDRAIGVQFDHCGTPHTVRAKREVILSAGTVNTAQLLMLSGIGPRKHLEDLDIPVVADLPVGDNMQDHLRVPVHFLIDPKIPTIQQKMRSHKNIEDYINNRTGIFGSVVSTLVAFLRTHEPSAIDNPDFQLQFADLSTQFVKSTFGLKPEVYQKLFRPYENKPMGVCYSQNMQPHSRGTVRLQSVNPYDAPLIDPNYYGDPRDMKDVVAGLKTCIKIISSAPMKKIKSKINSVKVPGCEKLSGDLFLECLARSIIITNHHPVGTAKMGDPEDPSTVVDAQLRVKYVENLRVVDASIMPIIPSANTNAATIMVAEKASDLIKNTINCFTQTPFTSPNEYPSSPYFKKLPYCCTGV